MRIFAVFSLVVLLVVSISSCSKFRKIQKNGDWKEKYDAALKYYEDEDYYRANILLDEILPIIKGTKEAELATYYYAYSHYHMGRYILSAHHFKSFYAVYNRSDYAMEALYMHAYSLYLQSPDYNLDQTPTYEAISAMQNFINLHPYAEFSEDANKIIQQLQQKLEKKGYKNALQYYKLRRYKSAIVAFELFNEEFPDSRYNEELDYLKIAAIYNLAKESISSKQKERYQKTIGYYQEFIDKYPTSQFISNAENFYSDSINQIDKLASK